MIEYSLAQLWMAWGIRPDAMIGHSIGEYVAACLSGVLSLEDALMLVAARGRMMQQLSPGAMLAVALPEQEIQSLLGHQLSLAAINGPALCVVSGPIDAVDALERQLGGQAANCRRLHTSHAFHSAMIDPIVGPFAELVGTLRLSPPRIPYVSNVTGTWMTAADAADPTYWARHLRGTVRFFAGLGELLADADRIVLEVGPGQTLTTFARQHPNKTADTLILGSLRHPNDRQPDLAFALTTLGRLWLAGAPVDSAALYARERRQRVLLPTYPFERQRYWIEPKRGAQETTRQESPAAKRADIADWFYIPIWKPSTDADSFDPASLLAQRSCWLLFSDPCGLATHLERRLRELGQDVVTVSAGQIYGKAGVDAYRIDPRRRADYDMLIGELAASGTSPQMIVHVWGVTPADTAQSALESCDRAQDMGFYSLLFLAQALGKHSLAPTHIGVVSNTMQGVAGELVRCPEKATVLGPCMVIPKGFPRTRVVRRCAF